MKKRYSKEQHEIIKNSRKFQRGDTLGQREALAKVLRMQELKKEANKIADILYKTFGKDFDVTKDEGFRRYHVSKKNGSVNELKEGQMVMTVTPNASLIIRLNSPEGDVVHMTKNLSKEDFVAELGALKAFIQHGTDMPATNKLVKAENTSGYTNDDVKEILKGYKKDPEGSKPK